MGGILLIDAEQPFAEQAIQALRSRGFPVHHASEGAEGLALASSERPELIVLCAELPDVKGYTIGNKLKKDDEFKSIPLILTSALATAETFASHRKLKVRADEYLHKPFDHDTLIATIGTLIPLPAAAEPAWGADAAGVIGHDFDAADLDSGDFDAAQFSDFDDPSGLHIEEDAESVLAPGPDSDLLLPDELDLDDEPALTSVAPPVGGPPPVPLEFEDAGAFDADDLMRELEHTGVGFAGSGGLDLTPAPLSMPDALDAEIEAELDLMGLGEELDGPDFGEAGYPDSAGLPELSLPDQLPLSDDGGAYDLGPAGFDAAPPDIIGLHPTGGLPPAGLSADDDDLYALLGDGSLSEAEPFAVAMPAPVESATAPAPTVVPQPWQPAPTVTQAAFEAPSVPVSAQVVPAQVSAPVSAVPAVATAGAHELQRVAQVQHENAELRARVVELESRLQAAEQTLQSAQDQLQQKSSSSSSSARDVIGLKEQLRSRDKELERMKDEIFEHEKHAVEVQEALDQARADRMAHLQATADKEAENAALRARVSALGAQRDELERVIHERLAAAEAERAQLREIVNGLQHERHALGGQLQEVQQRLQSEAQLRERARQAAEMALSLLSTRGGDGVTGAG